jgi:hypothetical protein
VWDLAGPRSADPYATVGVVAGVGYVLEGGLGSRLMALLLGVVTRVALATCELGDRLYPRHRHPVIPGSPEASREQ